MRLVVILILACSIGYPQKPHRRRAVQRPKPPSDQWQLFDEGEQKAYFKRDSIVATAAGTLKVWVRNVPADLEMERKQFAKEFEGNPHKRERYKLYALNLTLYELRCAGREYRALEAVDYDANGKIIETFKFAELLPIKWQDAPPSTTIGHLVSLACRMP